MVGKTRSADLGRRWFAPVPRFDPSEGTTVLEPPGDGAGYWVGAPSILYDAEETGGTYYLYHRLRRPRGQGRGYVCRVSRSSDGVSFETIWEASKEQFDSPSVERACLVRTPEGSYRLYLSLVDGADGKWKVDLLEARSPADFRPQERRRVLDPDPLGLAGVKDPYLMLFGGLYWALLSYAPIPGSDASGLHATGDAYATGKTSSHTGLATSADGVGFDWQGDVLSPVPDRWDAYAARIGSVVPAGNCFLAFYDGGASVEENYEEKCGLAVSFDLVTFHRVSVGEPWLTSPEGSGSLRYLDAIVVGDEVRCYYEYARADGSHELRLSTFNLDA